MKRTRFNTTVFMYISGWVQWAEDGCFQIEDPVGTCEGMYDLPQGETLRLNEDQDLKDLIKVKCIVDDVRYTLEPMLMMYLWKSIIYSLQEC